MFNKGAVIERSLRRVLEIYRADPALADQMHIDALTLNVERACQAAIDLAMHVVASKHLGMPQSQADAFRLLADSGEIDRKLSERMIGMCGFRNILIHQYQDLELDLLHKVATEQWRELEALCLAFGLKIAVPE
ncbi:hypothetical protein DDZ13_10395 [Coraliomargarita sinensis]|uniref:DUF86 domain-containing protein n=2 Tax=Coraliomargarita sinensis TaxID=2174842 RepID=A0A317ZFZ3_9BACT|nr:hypothetical protein DDZ13_10395 [Coraliomargarita sinensis]